MVDRKRLLLWAQNYKAMLVAFMAVIGIVCDASSDNSVGRTRRNLASNVTDRPGFISIDCGATDEHYDSKLQILYKTDSEFIDAGENKKILSMLWNRSIYVNDWPHLQTLRSFPNGTKNCYKLEPEQGKNNKYLIRAMFWYGDYDNLSKIHIFDVYIGVNYWATMMSNQMLLEIIHTPSSDTIYVCLVNKGQGVPFINSLELRLLDNSSYPTTPRTALTAFIRQDLGKLTAESPLSAETPLWRYSDDAYDRAWSEYLPFFFNISKTAAVIKEDNGNPYRLPASVLRNGAIASNYTTPLQQSLAADPKAYYYVYFHFAEIESNRGTRKFDIHLNGAASKFVSLDHYLQTLTVIPEKPIAGPIEYALVARRDSSRPPILNALEVYQVLPLSFLETNEEDVNAIMDMKKIYGIAKDDWQGDPCFRNFTWNGLACNEDTPPRIMTLNLTSHDLEGTIAPSLASLTALESLDLSFNKLNGTVPEFLGNLPSLKAINLTGNNLSGSVPLSIIEKQKAGALTLSLCGNADLVLSQPCDYGVKPEAKKNKNTTLVIAIPVALVLAISVVIGLIINYLWQRRRAINEGVAVSSVISRGSVFKTKTREFKYFELVSITDNFKRVIGEGGFGKVYQGILKDGSEVAVKLLSSSSHQGIKEFRAEAEILSKIHHKNLVSFVGYCDDRHNMALIYEYMPNGNLQQHVLESTKNVLSWKDRLLIAVDSSRGIEYLHSGCKLSIIHRDLKSSNILLNKEFQAKIADFGLSRMFANENDTNLMTTFAGTLGYLDPEYHSIGKLSTKSDVYSFGVVLLELITGRSCIIKDPENMHIIMWVKNLLETGDIEGIVDPRLEGHYNVNSVSKAIEISMACVSPHAIQRPNISYVHSEFQRMFEDEVGSENCSEMNINNKMTNTSEINPISADVSMSFSGPR